MYTKLLSILCLLFILSSCSHEMGEKQILEALIDGDGDAIHSAFYKDYRIDKEKLNKIVDDYSAQINEKNLKALPFRDQINFRKRDRYGFLFVDKDNNLFFTVTFKYSTMKDGEQLINFMDFRTTEHDVNGIQFPSLRPLRTMILPISAKPVQSEIDSVLREGPRFINGIKFYHNYQLNSMYMSTFDDQLKKNVISFNLGNKSIKDNMESIISKLSTQIDLNEYSLAYYEDFGQPTIFMGYERNFPNNVKKALENIFKKEMNLKVQYRRNRGTGHRVNVLDVGGTNTDPRRRFRF